MNDIINCTGSAYCYDYQELPYRATTEQIRRYCSTTKRLFLPIARNFTDQANSLWVLRHYLALKFTISASMLSGSALYARNHNLLMAVPYFNYYALLNCCRAFLMTSPDIVWKGRNTVEMTHSKILNVTSDLLRRLDRAQATLWGVQLQTARAHRELYSYRFPASGLELVGMAACDPDKTADLARLIAELAMLNSECFEACLEKHSPKNIQMLPLEDHDWAVAYKIMSLEKKDQDDKYRFGKFISSRMRVSTLEVMASDGLVEDFYGGWCAPDAENGFFDPDDYTRHILNL